YALRKTDCGLGLRVNRCADRRRWRRRYRRRVLLAWLLARVADRVSHHGVFAARSRAILLLGAHRKTGVSRLRELHLAQQHGGEAVQVAVDVAGLVTVTPQAPCEHADAVEIEI